MKSELKKIACVEDEKDIAAVAKMALEAIGHYQVEVFSSGSMALEQIPVFQPDLVIMDVMMPGMDGPTTLKKMRELPGFEKTPVIFMTAKIMSSEVQYFLSLGAKDVIAKPFDPLLLPQKVREVWEKS